MRKLLAVVLLTFRWLLVPSLPVVGLVVGLWLMPQAKPTWELELPPDSQCAGTIADGKMAYLLLYSGQIHELDMPTYHQLTGIDLYTGAELFSRKIPCERTEQMQLLPGTTYALRWNRIRHDAMVTLYDWKQEKELNQFMSPEIYYDAPRFDFKNGVLAITKDTSQGNSMRFWRLQGEQSPDGIKMEYTDTCTVSLNLSPKGSWACRRCAKFLHGRRNSPDTQTELIGTRNGQVVQTLTSEVDAINWKPEEDAFLALERDRKIDDLHWRKYVYFDGSFVPSGPAVSEKKRTSVLDSSPSPYMVLVTTNLFDSIRLKVRGWLGKTQQATFNRLWPVTTTLHFMQQGTGDIVRSLTLPGTELFPMITMLTRMRQVHPDPQGQGVVVQQDANLTYWEFSPVSRWYPWAALSLGVLLALFVARSNLSRPVTHKPLGSQS